MLLELSYDLSEDMPVYPDSPEEKYRRSNDMNLGAPCNTSVVEHYIHAGTHVDAPFHFDNSGRTIDQIPIGDFCFTKVVVVPCELGKSGLIGVSQIQKVKAAKDADILLFHTGYSEKRNFTNVYVDDFPALSEEAALHIRNELLNVKAVAIDTLSIESAVDGPAKNFRVHKALLDMKVSKNRTLLIFEDVNVALAVGRRITRLFAFPLRLKGIEGSPVAMVAEVES